MGKKHKGELNLNPKRHIFRMPNAIMPPRLYEHLFRTACDWALHGDAEAAQWVMDELIVMDRESKRREYESWRVYTPIRKSLIGKPCVKCGKPADTVDHIIPMSRGGTNDPDNLQPMCWDCNRRKGAKVE